MHELHALKAITLYTAEAAEVVRTMALSGKVTHEGQQILKAARLLDLYGDCEVEKAGLPPPDQEVYTDFMIAILARMEVIGKIAARVLEGVLKQHQNRVMN